MSKKKKRVQLKKNLLHLSPKNQKKKKKKGNVNAEKEKKKIGRAHV